MAIKRTATGPAAPASAPFSRSMPVSKLRRDAETPFRIAAEPEECAAVARFLGVDRIDRLSFAGFIVPAAGEGWRVRGHLVANIVQSCVVTLEPVPGRHDIEIDRLYLPEASFRCMREVDVGAEDEDVPDPFTDALDPAALAVETLALAIDPYPRAEGAELGRISCGTAGVEEPAGPFASLAALRDRDSKGGG